MVSRLAVIALVASVLAGCNHTSNCAGWSPIRPSRADTAETKAQVLKHNSFGVAQGCFTKPSR